MLHCPFQIETLNMRLQLRPAKHPFDLDIDLHCRFDIKFTSPAPAFGKVEREREREKKLLSKYVLTHSKNSRRVPRGDGTGVGRGQSRCRARPE